MRFDDSLKVRKSGGWFERCDCRCKLHDKDKMRADLSETAEGVRTVRRHNQRATNSLPARTLTRGVHPCTTKATRRASKCPTMSLIHFPARAVLTAVLESDVSVPPERDSAGTPTWCCQPPSPVPATAEAFRRGQPSRTLGTLVFKDVPTLDDICLTAFGWDVTAVINAVVGENEIMKRSEAIMTSVRKSGGNILRVQCQ